MKVLRYGLTPGVQMVPMPSGAQLVYVGVQRGVPCVWALCDPDAEEVESRIAIVATGEEAPSDGRYVGTFQIPDVLGPGADFVGHVFAAT